MISTNVFFFSNGITVRDLALMISPEEVPQ